jgi:hypothetical protein
MTSSDTCSSETQEEIESVAVKKDVAPKANHLKTQGILIGLSVDKPTMEKSTVMSSKRKPRRRHKSRAVKSLDTTDSGAMEQTCTTETDDGISSSSQSSSAGSLMTGRNDDTKTATTGIQRNTANKYILLK